MRTHIMKTNHVLILGAFVLSIVPAAATAEAHDTPAGSPPATATKVATVEGITAYRLDNGLRFLMLTRGTTRVMQHVENAANRHVNGGYLDGAQRQRSSDDAIASILNYNLYLDRTMEFVAQQEAAIEALTPDDLLAAMRRHIDPEKISIFRAGDFANKLAR